MKGDTVLDLVVFQLTAPRTRCELYVSADGMTEKLASGFLKPFLNHLRAVEEQVVRGCESVKLERPQTYHGGSWFTKGTLERFVRFVSTPEVLERVKFVEDELAQLEQVRGIQASSLLQVEDSYSTADPVYQRNDGKSFSGPLEKLGNSKLLHNDKYDAVEGGREASKVELLRAMDVRLLALRQEQSMAFTRAAAAGFNSDNMTDLIAFSEFFGADRLRVACFNFLIVLQGRVLEPTKLNPQAILDTCANASRVSVLPKDGDLPRSDLKLTKGDEAEILIADHHISDERRHMIDDGILSVTDYKSGFDGMQSRGAGGSDARKRWGPPENIRPELFAEGHTINHAPASVSPNHQMSSIMKPTGESAEEQTKAHLSVVSSPVSAPARRLSVQDAISMFEDKQRREYIEASRKQRIGKHESGRASLEGTNALPSASTGPRRWSVANSNEVGKILQENVTSSKQKVVTISSETVRGNGDILLPRLKQEIGPQTNAFLLKASNTALHQLCPDRMSVKVSDVEKQVSVKSSLEYEAQGPCQLTLGRSIAQGTPSRMPVKQGPLKTESNVTMRPTSLLHPESDGTSLIKNPDCKIRDREPEKVGLYTASWEPIAIPDSSTIHAPTKRSEAAYNVQEVRPSRDRNQVPGENEQHTKDAATMVFVDSETATKQSSGRESVERSRVDSVQGDVQNHIRMHVDQSQSDGEGLDEQKGRFYEQYSKLRDTKLKMDNEFKKAEREAKLRFMEETLLLRKAELDAQTMKLLSRNHEQVRATKLQARKADIQTLQRAKGDAVDGRDKEISSHSNSRARSPPFTLSGKEEVSSSKSPSGRKFSSAVPQKGVTPPRSSTRGTSLSPKLTPRSVTSSTAKPRKSVANDNLLIKSVPSFASLRKENAKPSAGCPAGLQTKDGGSGRFRAPSEPLEANENILDGTPRSIIGPAKEDKGLPLVWRSYCDLRMLSTLSDDGASAPPTHQREVGCGPGAFSSLKGYGVSPLMEVWQSAKEGDLGSNEGTILNLESDTTNATDQRSEDTDSKDVFVEDSMETDTDEADFSIDSGLSNALEMQAVTPATALSEETVEVDASFANRNAYQTTSSPSYIETCQHLASGGCLGEAQALDSNPYSQSEKALQSMYVPDESTSFRASSLPHEHHLPMFSHGTALPPNSKVEKVQIGTVSGHFSPSSAAGFESPLLSPAYWNVSQTQYAAAPQKLVATKEPAKGFKKLLKFGRKNRTADTTMPDWASTFMTSEGDDESEDQRFSMDAHIAKGRRDESRATNIQGEHYGTPEKTLEAQSLRSSIPTPPADFKLRDEHLMGGTMLKAPKSFFSLSSFRSRGTEGRV